MGLRWIVYLHLSLSQGVFDRLILTKHCRCFGISTKGTDGAPDLLQALSQSPLLEELFFQFCSQIPAAAWQKVRSAKWLHLKKANFQRCLAERNGWGVFLFSTCIILCLLDVVRVQICKDLWSCRMSPSWPVMTWMGLRWTFYLHCVLLPTCFRQIDADTTLQVLLQRHPRSRWRRRFAWSLGPVTAAGRVVFPILFSDPSSSVAKSS